MEDIPRSSSALASGRGSTSHTLVGLARDRADQRPQEAAYRFLAGQDELEVADALTYAQLDQRARSVAARLASRARPGDRAVLLYPPGLDFVVAFYGCLYAGVMAVPVSAPHGKSSFRRALPRLRAIFADATPSVVLASDVNAQVLASEWPELEGVVNTEGWGDEAAASWRDPGVTPDALAFLQYTSGSTAIPKGVMVSHRNVLANSAYIAAGFGHSAESVSLSWLPHFHDMGLIDGIIQPLVSGFVGHLMSPVVFSQRPLSWLRAISRRRVTHSGGPNFAYDLCARKITPEECEALDLRSWRVAYCGAEPVRRDTLEEFAQRFAGAGFSPRALYPCYGLAEATLKVSGGPPGGGLVAQFFDADALERHQAVTQEAGSPRARALVACGRVDGDTHVAIVQPSTLTPCADGEVGEIWVSGPGVAQGYWQRPDETERTFRAHLAGTGAGPYLRTGDLGFFREGQLSIAGRLKDLIILRGRNIYPQDIERTVDECDDTVRAGGCAAFSIDVEGEEQLAVAVEARVRSSDPVELARVVAAVRRAVHEAHEVHVHTVVLLQAGGVPKTSSGKIMRRACRDGVRAGTLKELFRDESGERDAGGPDSSLTRAELLSVTGDTRVDLLAAHLRAQLARILRVESPPDEAQPLSSVGLDSLMAMELAHRMEKGLGIDVPMTAILGDVTTRELARELSRRLDALGPESTRSVRAPGPVTGALAEGQRALWLLQKLAPSSSAYNVSFAAGLRATTDRVALRAAFERIVERHAILRTVYPADQARPVARLLEGAPLDYAELDASALDEAALHKRLSEEAARPFDLEHDRVFRVRVFRRGPGEDVLLVVVHHIAVDLWSLVLVMHELRTAYSAARLSAAAPESPPGVTYADFAAWQERYIQGPEGQAAREYFREALRGAAELELPTDRPRPPVAGDEGATRSLMLDAELTQRLRALGVEHGTTLFVVLLSAFQAFLGRHCGQDDVVVGVPMAGRTRARFENVVGYFVNTLPVRARVSPEQPFAGLLGRVRAALLGTIEHQDYPFTRIVDDLRVPRAADRTPVFQVLFAMEKPHLEGEEALALLVLGESGGRVSLGELELEPRPIERKAAMFDLALTTVEVGGGISASFEYRTDLFDARTIDAMAGSFETFLRHVAEEPHKLLGELPWLPNEERSMLLEQWGRGKQAPVPAVSVEQAVQAQARRAPQALAIVSEGMTLTYGELDARAHALARVLRDAGVGPEVPVGICVPRSSEFVIAVLGAMKAGGAYVPLDPSWPAKRMEHVLAEVGAPVLLSAADLRLESYAGRVLRAEAWPPGEVPAPDEPAARSAWDELAYVIYTSGSTGQPKGVMVSRGALANHARWVAEEYGLGAGDRVSFFSSTAFDVAGEEVWPTLAAGATLVIRADGPVETFRRWTAWLEEHRVTVVNLPASFWHAWVGELEAAMPPESLRLVVVGSERVDPEKLRSWRRVLRGRALRWLNAYGPTEATITASVYEPPAGSSLPEGAPAVPIGRPVHNAKLFVLDGALRPVPIGVPGELYIGGAGLARGYLGQPEATAAAFIPDPFSSAPGARLYRTGDRARWLPEGVLSFLGRRDAQVKLHGYRIEVGEIEAVLARHPSVRQSAVLLRGTGGGGELVAYVSLVDSSEGALRQLRAFVGEHLPAYMLPTRWQVLDSLPMLSSGKLDRQALERQGPADEEGDAEPLTEPEQRIARILGELLGRERVGARQNFFELGGHSLLAAQAAARIGDAFGLELGVRTIFEAPTVELLAARLVDAKPVGRGGAAELVQVARNGDIPASFAQERLWVLGQLAPASAAYNMPVGLRLSGPLDVGALREALNALVERHEALRTTLSFLGEQLVQVIGPGRGLPLRLEDVSEAGPAERRAEALRRIAAAACTPFDLGRGPLVSATAVRIEPEEHLLLLNLHHAIADGWSIEVLLRDLGELYSARVGGRSPSLPKLPVQYAEFAAWERRAVSGEALERDLGYWRSQLTGAPASLALPLDRARPGTRRLRGAQVSFTIDPRVSAALRELSRAEGATLFMTLLSAWKVLLFRYTGQTDLVVGTPVAARGRPEFAEVVGCFINTLAIRSDLSRGPSFRELLGAVRASTLEAYAHSGVPFERVVEALGGSRDPAHSPVFQTMLAMQEGTRRDMRLAGLEVTPVPPQAGGAKFDLTLSIGEERGTLAGELEYDTDLFEPATAERITRHFERLLRSIMRSPGARLATLELLDETERRRSLARTPGPVSGWPREACLHQLFERHAAVRPDTLAVVARDGTLSYGELNRRANALARSLRARGVGPEALVGICLERSVELAVAVLAVLKAGGAYLPIDPTLPASRISAILADAPVALVLVEGAAAAAFGEAGIPRMSPTEAAAHGDGAGDNLDVLVAAEGAAYVIPTSGSTGRPKMVCCTHVGVINLLDDLQRRQRLEPGSACSCWTSLSFDVSVYEIFSALTAGGTVYLVPEEVRADGAAFVRYLGAHRIASAYVPPFMLEELRRHIEGGGACALRRLLVGVEPIDQALLASMANAVPGLVIINGYGPSETSVCATLYTVPAGQTQSQRTPIGGAVQNTSLYVLDSALEPVPPGVIGTLYVAGAGVARGYCNRPDATAERFLPDPFSELPGARMYNTGDLVRHRPEGELEFVGRADNQVKIRGFRIELGDVEFALCEHPDIAEAAVVVHGEAGLATYVVARSGHALEVRTIRPFLLQRVPSHMVPTAIMALPSMPRTPSGKIDRRALPPPGPLQPETDRSFVMPRDDAERTIAAVWAEVLGVERVGIHDDFFELGGQSLLAARVMSRLGQKLGVELPLRELFETPTVAGLRAALDRIGSSSDGPIRAEAEPAPDVDAMSDEDLDALLNELNLDGKAREP